MLHSGILARLMLVLAAVWACICTATSPDTHSLHRRGSIANGIKLRILPIGDSITRGLKQHPDVNYREPLYNKLIEGGNFVEMVGSQRHGSFAQNRHEGHGGKKIDEIQINGMTGIEASPNIALLHAGTNNMNTHSLDVRRSVDDLEDLIRNIHDESPGCVIIVAKIIPSWTAITMDRINVFNGEVEYMVERLAKATTIKTMLVDMTILDVATDFYDALHSNQQGTDKMVRQWYDAIKAADKKGWIKQAAPPDFVSKGSCHKPEWNPPVRVALGARRAFDDGPWTQGWRKLGRIAQGNCPRSRLHFMDLNGDGIKDYACVSEDNGAVYINIASVNSAGKQQGKWGERHRVASGGDGRKGSGVKFADLNGDGRDDYVWLDERSGFLHGWINGGPGSNGGGWIWHSLGRISNSVGATKENLHFADINGDGRDDFLIIEDGRITAWLNRGDVDKGDRPDWSKLGVIATGATAGSETSVWMGDLTGEGRADYLIVGGNGKTTGFVNRLQKGSLYPGWEGVISIAAGPDGARRPEVRFADLDGDGDVDYLLVDKDSGAVDMWENAGTGGRYQEGEGVKLADLDGDGAADYIWLDHNGNAYGYINKGKTRDDWDDKGLIHSMGIPYDRNLIHFARLTFSNRTDFIVVESNRGGRAIAWTNNGLSGNSLTFSKDLTVIAQGGRSSVLAQGWPFFDENVRFADLDGDGLDDYIYVSNTGAVLWWRNLGGTDKWDRPQRVARGVGVMARDIRFADVDGDGSADYITMSEVDGSAHVWLNRGFNDDGTGIRWARPSRLARGPVNTLGRDIRIVDMTGDGRADYVGIDPANGGVRLWENRCEGLSYAWEDMNCGAPEFKADISIANWNSLVNRKGDFAWAAGVLWHNSESFQCGSHSLGNGCTTHKACSGDDDSAVPARVYLHNSFVNLNFFFHGINENLFKAVSRVNEHDIADTFEAPPPEEVDWDLVFSAVDLVYGMWGSKAFKAIFARVAGHKSSQDWDSNGSSGELVMGSMDQLVGMGTGLLQKHLENNKPEGNSGQVLGVALDSMVWAMTNSTIQFQKRLFDGTPQSISLLERMVANGAVMNGVSPKESLSDLDMQKDFEKALYAVLIPQAWLLSKKRINPVVLQTDDNCSSRESKTDICKDGKLWKLRMARGPECTLNVCPPEDRGPCIRECYKNDFGDLHGIDTLTEGLWAGLTAEDFIRGAIATWENSGKENRGNSQKGAGLLNPITGGTRMRNIDVRSPGVVTIPVCKEADARRIWKEGKEGKPKERPNYPCP